MENPNDQYQCLFIAVYQEPFILLMITHNLVLFDIQTFSNMTIIKTAHTEKKREMKSMNAPAPVLFPMVDKELIQPLQVSNQHIVQTVQLKVSSDDLIWPKWQLVLKKLKDRVQNFWFVHKSDEFIWLADNLASSNGNIQSQRNTQGGSHNPWVN